MEESPGPRPHDPTALLLALTDAVARGVAPPDHVVHWLLAGTESYLAGDGDIGHCLGFKLTGWPPSKRRRYERRDMALAEAAHLLDGDLPLLAAQIRRFRALDWRHDQQPPPRATPVQRLLHRAAAEGLPLPQSVDQLSRICS